MDCKATARRLVEESIVLLKNEGRVLPFCEGQRVAFFGRTQCDLICSGNGSGAARTSKSNDLVAACEERGICAEPTVKAYYQEQAEKDKSKADDAFDWSKIKDMVNSGIMYELFGRYHAPTEEYKITEKQMQDSAKDTDTAICILGRDSGGEECDRHLQGDYYLTESEKALLAQVCGHFEKVVLVLNINGLVDLSWVEEYKSLKSILFVGIPGEEGVGALADVLTGKVNPSGKLPVTIAKAYKDYPCAEHFSWDKDDAEGLRTYESYGLDARGNGSIGYDKSPVTVYFEDIYAGYRYFDTFDKEPLFAFGYGLSYSEFKMEACGAEKLPDGIKVTVNVKNVGDVAGRETAQLYLSVLDGKSECARQALKGFEKTKRLAAGEEERVSIFIPWREFACYEEKRAAYVIEQGKYQLSVGNSSRNTWPVASVDVPNDILVEQCKNGLGIQACNKDKLTFLTQEKARKETEMVQKAAMDESVKNGEAGAWKFTLAETDWLLETSRDEGGRQESGKVSGTVKDLSLNQLAALCVGYGPGTPFASMGDGSDPETIYDEAGKPVTTNSHPMGFNGYVSPAIEEKKITSVFYKDGPAGVGETAWPSEMLIACAFDKDVWYEFGNAVGEECERQKVDIWLAPAVNLHRHPLGGRNFEYFSEDPYLTGICACEITKGVQENHPVLVCAKHFAVNEQETYRRGSAKKNYDAADSIISERAARELYLKPFEMLVREAHVHCIMTSFNKINGVFAGGNKDLCTQILRKEWGFDGAVVTDWGDMDVVVDGADAVAAGNDIVMPGGPPVIAQILAGYREGRVTRSDMETAVTHLLEMKENIQA